MDDAFRYCDAGKPQKKLLQQNLITSHGKEGRGTTRKKRTCLNQGGSLSGIFPLLALRRTWRRSFPSTVSIYCGIGTCRALSFLCAHRGFLAGCEWTKLWVPHLLTMDRLPSSLLPGVAVCGSLALKLMLAPCFFA